MMGNEDIDRIDRQFFDKLRREAEKRKDKINKRASQLIRQKKPVYVAIQQADFEYDTGRIK